MRHPSQVLLAAICGILLALAGAPAAQQTGPSLPALSHTCPHHPDVIESTPGSCPFCKMSLVPVRLSPAWSCPIHPATLSDESGACPICGRPLVRVTTAVTWRCTGSTEEFLEPGLCLDGRPRTRTQALRPHGDHNPRHGGQFFMAPDNWHHVEGTHPSPGVFRFYVYDDYARPLPDAELRRLQARVVTRERFDPATRRTIEDAVFPLRLAQEGGYLETRVDRSTLPAEMTAKIRFASGGEEYRFDFTFIGLSAAPQPPAATGAARGPGAPGPAGRTPAAPAVGTRTAASASPAAAAGAAPDPDASPESAAAPDPALAIVPVPETVPGIVGQLRLRRGHVADLIARGDFTAVWVPAFAARDLAIALEPHLVHLDAATRDTVAPALQSTVRLAWLLDAFGDSGNRQQLDAAYEAFSNAVDHVLSAFEHMDQP